MTLPVVDTNKDAIISNRNINLISIDHGWGSAWSDQSVDLSKDWVSSFSFNAGGGSGTSDGYTFVINGDPRGVLSIGDGGGDLGFFGFDTGAGGGIRNSYAVTFRMWSSNGPSSLVGFSPSSDIGDASTYYQAPISIANNAYSVQIAYQAATKVLSATLGGKTFTQDIDLSSTLGKSGYLGFTAANGGGTMDMYVTDWNVTASEYKSAPVVRGNSLYTIVDGPSWTQAEANSVKLGGHLVTINDDDENNFVNQGFSNNAHNAYIGYSDLAVEGNWIWSSGELSSFTKWGSTLENGPEPNNLGEEDYTLIDLIGGTGLWNDGKNYGVNFGIAETPFIRRGDSAYVIVQGPTWEEAEENAVKLGGHLVTINDAAENEWIKQAFSSVGFGGHNNDAWIGLHRQNISDSFSWTDGSSIGYSNWYPGEPNGSSQPGPYATNYGGMWLGAQSIGHSGSMFGFWNDYGNDLSSRGIAEIKLSPKNTPIGTPTLSGTAKVGQVISIDKTPIQDADNFTGYTPTYNYSFEVSNDNGTSWTKLTSADATDNNSTYTLTKAEVGKKVRGVVSYLDGYGTNESVASAGSTNVLVPSNTAPTAVQTLTGSSKVGRVLTADKSTIVDPDGLPTSVSYGWEVSANGTTWTKLTSADATDNNSTYALTAGELGKTVRSVISYTDGYGTNETVRSAATTAVAVGNKPTSISLSSSSIVENVGANVAVAKLRSVDVDTDDAFKYSLVSGTGSTDNNKFNIAGDQLLITTNPDYETKNSYSIRVRTTDLGGLFVDKSLVLKVTNVNEAPIAINLSDSDFLENIAAGSVIGNLGSIDPDRDTAFTYSLTPNSARATFADNQFFSIVNDQLKINAIANFEQKDSYTISVRSTDAGKLFYDQVFTLVVQDVDEAPTDISITGTGIDEGAAVGSIVGTLVSTDQDESSTDFTYALVAGTKANNNDLFEIVGEQLKTKSVFNFETKSSYVVNVRTTDEAGLTFDKSITIKVNNVNENPTDLTVSATAFNENVAIGTTVSTLGVLDPDKTGTYTYSLVSGVGDKDNQAFLIAGNALKVNVATDYEIQKSYSVRLRVTDQGGLSFEKSVALGVNNLVEKVSSVVSTTLAPDKDTLELTGTKNVFGMGNQFDNTIMGNSGKNKLVGGLGKDILTGGAGVDTFFYNDLKESLLSGFDVITDYASGERIVAGFLFEGEDLIASTGKATALNEGAIGSVLTNITFLANNSAAFTVEGLTGTFLALNDGRDGFQADSDALIHLSKYTIGSTTPISII